jgi:hypothetical protein
MKRSSKRTDELLKDTRRLLAKSILARVSVPTMLHQFFRYQEKYEEAEQMH